MSRRYCAVLAVVMAMLGAALFVHPTSAAPAAPVTVTLTQPNGETFEARLFGDEWENGYETLDGYTVIQSELTGYWYYASQNEAGELTLSYRLPASDLHPERRPPQDVPQHLRDESAGAVSQEGINGRIAPQASNIGTQHVLVLLASFSDQASVGSTEAQWQDSFFAATNSVNPAAAQEMQIAKSPGM